MKTSIKLFPCSKLPILICALFSLKQRVHLALTLLTNLLQRCFSPTCVPQIRRLISPAVTVHPLFSSLFLIVSCPLRLNGSISGLTSRRLHFCDSCCFLSRGGRRVCFSCCRFCGATVCDCE